MQEKQTDIQNQINNDTADCIEGSDCCSPELVSLSRRDMMGITAKAGVLASALGSLERPVMAGPFDASNPYQRLIQEDKKLDPSWVKSLFERGKKETYSDPQSLAHIGMPIGGFFAGTVYISGDGSLWLWDIFNKDQEGIDPRKSDYQYEEYGGKPVKFITRWGLNYREPAIPKSPFSQGFKLLVNGKERSLDRQGFSDVSFDGRYPLAKISYQDEDCPLKVGLSAFSPFIPLNLDDSSLPTTVIGYKLRNTSSETVEFSLAGHLENAICLETAKGKTGSRINRVVQNQSFSAIECTASGDSEIQRQRDFGSMTLMLLGVEQEDTASAQLGETETQFEGDIQSSLIGTLGRKATLKANEEVTITFALCWHFPNFTARGIKSSEKNVDPMVGHHYASRFDSALEVAGYLAKNQQRLFGETQSWVDTWYDSTLPYWLLDRSMANTSILATTTCYRFKDGRFWAWEGVGCCQGTCTHVWHYAQAPGRLFPEVERITRERVDFGLALHEDGGIGMRASLTKAKHMAIDGHCGRILSALREHQMSSDNAFLKRIWPNVRKALEFLIRQDPNKDGILEGKQQNTLDAAWYGKVSFTSSLNLAALRAGEEMATEMGDVQFAEECRMITDEGSKNFSEMFDGEYFHQIEDPKYLDNISSGIGCFIDQVFGQSWAHWVGLGELFNREQTLSALRSLWKYNFIPDVGPFREKFKLGRWYAMAGDAGLVMCTWPKGGMREDQEKIPVYRYFSECMSGFEHQVAAHMVWESHDQPDLLEKGLAVERAIHDRYNAALRNPYNEIECSDHYSRSMASYGVFQAACGYEYSGPQGKLSFAPRLTPEDFRSAFTTAEGWGTFSQKVEKGQQSEQIELRYGKLSLKWLSFKQVEGTKANGFSVKLDDEPIEAKFSLEEGDYCVQFDSMLVISAGQKLEVTF